MVRYVLFVEVAIFTDENEDRIKTLIKSYFIEEDTEQEAMIKYRQLVSDPSIKSVVLEKITELRSYKRAETTITGS